MSDLHTYIHNWPLQPFSQDYGLASHTTHVVCVNFKHEWRDLQFNVDSERKIFEKLFHGRFIYSQSFCQKSAERKSLKKYFSYFNFDDWPGIRIRALTSNKPTYLLHTRLRRLHTYPPRSKSASSEKMIFFAKIGIFGKSISGAV